eukprot:708369-Rhodomonas_salina.2
MGSTWARDRWSVDREASMLVCARSEGGRSRNAPSIWRRGQLACVSFRHGGTRDSKGAAVRGLSVRTHAVSTREVRVSSDPTLSLTRASSGSKALRLRAG